MLILVFGSGCKLAIQATEGGTVSACEGQVACILEYDSNSFGGEPIGWDTFHALPKDDHVFIGWGGNASKACRHPGGIPLTECYLIMIPEHDLKLKLTAKFSKRNTASGVSYSTSSTILRPGFAWNILAEGDLNGDEFNDLVIVDPYADDYTRRRIRIVYSDSGVGFSEREDVFEGDNPEPINPSVLIEDFNNDGRNDLAIFDGGRYDPVLGNVGEDPLLYYADEEGIFHFSDALMSAYLPLVEDVPDRVGTQTDTTVGIKDVAAADIDNDGDLDIWVESNGSKNIESHFLINEGGSFKVDIYNRLAYEVQFGQRSKGQYRRYGIGQFLDVNEDGLPDLLLGQIRDNDPTHIDQTSYLIINDGLGFFKQKNTIALPRPKFYKGYTAVYDAIAADINGDAAPDLVLLHTRNDGVSGPNSEQAWTGTYVQILINSGGLSYIDVSEQFLGDQSRWSSEGGDAATKLKVQDIDFDGYKDLLLYGYSYVTPDNSTPRVFWGSRDRGFTLGDPGFIGEGDSLSALQGITPFNANNDGLIDFIRLDGHPGEDGIYETPDDSAMLILRLGSL
jgi:hypothetical protein